MTTHGPRDIRAFFDYWRSRADFIGQLSLLPEHHHEANVLAFSALDSLANLWALAFNKTDLKKKHARRFGEFVAACAARPDVFDRISLPYLRWRANTKTPSFPANALHILQTYSAPLQSPPPYSWEARKCRSLSDDPTVSTLLATGLAPVAQAKDGAGRPLSDWLLDSRFGEIAYREFRCAWLHEGRPGEATHSFNLGTDTEPSYLTNDYSTPPQINFPTPFLVATIRACIDHFEQQVLANGLDPIPPQYATQALLSVLDDLDTD
jgi:hypothetical protein